MLCLVNVPHRPSCCIVKNNHISGRHYAAYQEIAYSLLNSLSCGAKFTPSIGRNLTVSFLKLHMQIVISLPIGQFGQQLMMGISNQFVQHL